ncbi:MAG TPA: bifunctional diguanylate cyclase/phosphodiesterase [Gaiellales bacterium]
MGAHATGRRPLGALREAASLAGVAATIVAMLCLSAFAWTTIRTAASASDRVHEATAAAARYDSAAGAVERVQTIETRYAFSPSSGAATALGRSQRALHGAIGALRAHATSDADRATATRLATDDRVLDGTLARLHAAVAHHDGATVGGLETGKLHPLIQNMRSTIGQERGLYIRSASTNMAASGSAGSRLSIVALITAALGVAVSLAVLRMVRLRRRLGAAHRRELERLRTAALRDGLTGLPNHRCFHEDLREAIADSRGRHLLLVDVDSLKNTNDGHGHKAGDELLVKLGTALDQVGAAHSASAYRLGGDEFVLLVDPADDSDRVAAEIHTACGRSAAPQPSATVAVASWEDGVTAEELIRRAEVALMTAKVDRAPSRHYSVHLESGPSQADIERAQLLAILDTPGSITPVFQPIFDLRSQEVVGYEALSRFPAEVGYSPQEWFDLARKHGLAVELEAAAVQAALAVPGRPGGVSLSLNLSPEALLSGRATLNLPADLSAITIEVTENALVTEGPELELALQDLRARGARLAVDDAGVGYAGFAQLVRVRPDVVKLDRSLVESVNVQPTKAAVIKAFVGFAQDTGALICAEGIETAGELRVVRLLGSATGQGFLLGRPDTDWAPAGPALELPAPRPAEAGVLKLRRAAS